jgi:CW_7 repeat
MALTSASMAAVKAEASERNNPGMCQAWTRGMYNAPSVGDVDKDGDADAVDGWKKEPEWARHSDRNPPRGAPVAFSGGSKGFGHRAISIGNGYIRSTDAPQTGRVGTVTIGWIEKNWNMKYLGWSSTISGLQIPGLPGKTEEAKPAPKPEPAPSKKPKLKSLGVIAQEVIAGKWGNGEERQKKLENAGYSYSAVQAEVNHRLNR